MQDPESTFYPKRVLGIIKIFISYLTITYDTVIIPNAV